eukprot:1172682-Prorocentrum_minimum.AAC.8
MGGMSATGPWHDSMIAPSTICFLPRVASVSGVASDILRGDRPGRLSPPQSDILTGDRPGRLSPPRSRYCGSLRLASTTEKAIRRECAE